MRPWRQTQDQQPRLRIAKPRHRLSPILLVPISPTLHPRDFAAMLPQARTSLARDYFSEEAWRVAGITDGLVRLSIGIEDWRDLLADFQQALEP